MFSTLPHECQPQTPRDVQQLGFFRSSLTGGNDVPAMNEAVGNSEPPHCPKHLHVPIVSPQCPEQDSQKLKVFHGALIPPAAIAHQGAKGKIKPSWVMPELENS